MIVTFSNFFGIVLDGKHLMRFQSEIAVFKFLCCTLVWMDPQTLRIRAAELSLIWKPGYPALLLTPADA